MLHILQEAEKNLSMKISLTLIILRITVWWLQGSPRWYQRAYYLNFMLCGDSLSISQFPFIYELSAVY